MPLAGNGTGGVNGYDIEYTAPRSVPGSYPLSPNRQSPATSDTFEMGHRVNFSPIPGGTQRSTIRRRSDIIDLATVGSVPYAAEHWRTGRVSGDRVVAPRSMLARAVSLLWEPHPKLETLPFSAKPMLTQNGGRSGGGRERADSYDSGSSAGWRVNIPKLAARQGRTVRETHLWGSAFDLVGRDVNREESGAFTGGTGPWDTWSADDMATEFRVASSIAGTGQRTPRELELDGLSAMLLPRLVPGLKIGPNVKLAKDDEHTLVEEYDAYR